MGMGMGLSRGTIRIAYALDIDHHEYIGLLLINPNQSTKPLEVPKGIHSREQIEYMTRIAESLGFDIDKRQFDSIDSVEGKKFVTEL